MRFLRRDRFDEDKIDILNLLLSVRDENGEGLSDLELRDELISLTIGGHETTAISLTWALYWIHKYPHIYAKIMHELDSLGGDENPMSLLKLPYLSAVCQETLRIYPPIVLTIPRVVKSPVEIMGHRLEPGTEILGSIYLAHHQEDIYPDSKQFKPERFFARQYSPYEYLPFGGGNRLCIGMALVDFEMKLVLATILRRLKLALIDGRPLYPSHRGGLGLLAPPSSFSMVVR